MTLASPITESQCNRWSERETALLALVRETLAAEISEAGQFPEVVGDRGIMRFIRGHLEPEKILQMYGNYLKWRKETGADAIRERIRAEQLNRPSLFPNGEAFLNMSEQIIIAGDATDLEGNLIAFETFDYSPSEFLSKYSIDEWNEWMNYTLQYKTMVIEQVSEARERALLAEYNGCPPCTPEQGYGIIVQCTTIRCLKGMGMEFLSSSSKAIMKASIDICQNNFPEMMYKSHMVKTPWIFNTLWYFCKGLMDAKTIAKVNVMGYNFLQDLSKEIPITSIPHHFGGEYMPPYNKDFDFDWSPGGLMDLHGSKERIRPEEKRIEGDECAEENKVSEEDKGDIQSESSTPVVSQTGSVVSQILLPPSPPSASS